MATSDMNDAFRSGAWNSARLAASASGASISLSPENFGGLRVEGYDMRHVSLSRGRYSAVGLYGCDMRCVTIRGAQLSRVMLSKSLAGGLLMQGLSMSDCIWTDTDLVSARFEGVEMERCVFAGCSLRDSSFLGCEVLGSFLGLWGSDISGADLRELKGLAYNSVANAKWLESSPPLLPHDLERRVNANRRHFKYIDSEAGRYIYDSRPAEKFGSHKRDV